MAVATPTVDLDSLPASGGGSNDLDQEHEGNVLTTLNLEQALSHTLHNSPEQAEVIFYYSIPAHHTSARSRFVAFLGSDSIPTLHPVLRTQRSWNATSIDSENGKATLLQGKTEQEISPELGTEEHSEVKGVRM
jgi:hypothetical protein